MNETTRLPTKLFTGLTVNPDVLEDPFGRMHD